MGTKIYSTPYASVTATKNLAISELSASDLALLSETSNDVVETTTYSPLDRPEKWTFACKKVSDVYANTGIANTAIPAGRSGVQIMVRHDSVTQVTDSDDGSYLKQLPMSMWTCVRVPVNELITEVQILAELQRGLAGCFGDGEDVSSSRLASLVRGALRADN